GSAAAAAGALRTFLRAGARFSSRSGGSGRLVSGAKRRSNRLRPPCASAGAGIASVAAISARRTRRARRPMPHTRSCTSVLPFSSAATYPRKHFLAWMPIRRHADPGLERHDGRARPGTDLAVDLAIVIAEGKEVLLQFLLFG